MAPAAPWTVKTTKRQSVKNTPDPRKKRRASLPPEDQDGSLARRQKQQTLTQIQWAPSRPASFEEGEVEFLEVKTELRNRSRRRLPALKKRNSTLTQMDFLLGRPSIEMSEQDLTSLLVTKEEGAAVPQLDGIYESPRKPRPSKTLGAGGRSSSHRKRKSNSLPAEESQEYLPARKRRKGKADADEAHKGRRRRSARNAHGLPSDPAENFAVFKEAFTDTTPRLERPTLEIGDSTGFDENIDIEEFTQQNKLPQTVARPGPANHMQVEGMDEDVQGILAALKKTAPRTPQTKRDYIPSSQSPESLLSSTRKKDTTSHGIQRTPPKRNALLELSTNTPTRRDVTDVDDFLMPESTSKRKICTLNLPRVPPRPMKKRVEDSQVDIWALQPTSSPKSKSNGQRRPEDVLPDKSIQGEQPEIPSTSQAQNETAITSSPPHLAEAETQESLMSLNAIFRIERKENVDTSKESESQQASQASAASNVKSRDFVTLPQRTPQKQTQYVAFLQTQPGQIDEADEFGSPLANDTQFAAHLAHIPTSPIGTRDPLEHLNPRDTIRISSTSSPDGVASSSPQPAPKLVDRVAYQNSTTLIPTKDASSPMLPPMPPPTKQNSVAPASLPYPSQISTQEPSQQLPQLSSVPQRSPTRTQRITIKDSSSMHEHLSQLPEYNENELELQRELESTQHRVSDNDDDEDLNDDLDPRTPRKTVRNEQLPQRSALPEEEASVQNDSPSRPEEENNAPDRSPPANFTQNGHVTAARIEDMRKRGLIPPGYNPPAYKVPSARELLPAWMFEDDDDEL